MASEFQRSVSLRMEDEGGVEARRRRFSRAYTRADRERPDQKVPSRCPKRISDWFRGAVDKEQISSA
jgi:hypothetical protein